MRSAFRLSGVAGLAILLATSCATVKQPEGLITRVGDDSKVSASELRARVRDLAPRYSGELESLADTISERAADPQVRLNMVRFKINAVPQLQSALFRPDPVAALVDAWALLAQMQQALGRLSTERSLKSPELESLADQRFRELEAGIEDLWRELSGKQDLTWEHDFVHAWAEANPLDDTLAARVSTVPLLSRIAARSGVSLRGAAGQLLETTQDVAERIDLQSAYIPRQGRWQVEYLLRDLFYDPTLGDPAQLVDELHGALWAANSLPESIDFQRREVMRDVRRERLAVQQFVSAERAIILDRVSEERAITLAQLEQTGAKLMDRGIDRAFERGTALVDRLFLWLLALVSVAAVAAVLVALLLRGRRRPPEPHPVRLRRPAEVGA